MTVFYGTTQLFRWWKYYIATASNLSSDTLKMVLLSSAPDTDTAKTLPDLTGELSGNGYARQTLTGVLWNLETSVSRLSFDDVVFSASGGDWSATHWAIYDDTAGEVLVACGELAEFGSGVIVQNGNTLTVQSPDGLFTLE
jgi:hypothetical protein